MPSLRAYRRRFAKHVGSGLLAGTADGSSTRTYLADPTRRSSLAVGDDLVEWYLFRPAPGVSAHDRLRLVAEVDLERGWFFGDFPPGDQYDVAPAVGEVYELLAPEFHPDQIADFINEALRFALVPAEVEVPRVPSAGGEQPVTDFVRWLTTADGIYRVGSLGGGVARTNIDPYRNSLRGSAREVGGSVSLVLDGGAGAGSLAVGTLSAPLLAGTVATSAISPGPAWPTVLPCYVSAESELLQVVAQVGGSYALARGVSVTEAVDHPQGTVLYAPSRLVLHGLYPAAGLCRPAGGVYGAQVGLSLDTDEAIPDEQWIVAGALKEAWLTSPQTLEQMSERLRIANLEQASLAFARWQELTRGRMGVRRTFSSQQGSIFNVVGSGA